MEPPLDPPPDNPECPECDAPITSLEGCAECGWEPAEPDFSMHEEPGE